jgi:hypothetical protein
MHHPRDTFPICQAPWFNAPIPSGPDVEIWDVRAAMHDAIYYVPPKKTIASRDVV